MANKSPWRFSARSEEQLATVKPALAAVARRALELSEVDFGITEGKRTLHRQRILLAAGATTTIHSKHITGDALDFAAFVAGKIRWDWPLYGKIASAFKEAALQLDTKIAWGGDWHDFKDGPHIELVHGSEQNA